jgi:hypothetical protein
MNTLPQELIGKIIDTGDVNNLQKICNVNKRNKNICDSIIIDKITEIYRTPIHIFAELMLRVDIITHNKYDIHLNDRNDPKCDLLRIKSCYGMNNFVIKI